MERIEKARPAAAIAALRSEQNARAQHRILQSLTLSGRTHRLLEQRMVDAGWLGKKSGRGFYEYNQ